MNEALFSVGIIGFVGLISTNKPGARYIGAFFAPRGWFPAVAPSISRNANNISESPTKQTVSVAFQSSRGNFSDVIGSYAEVPSSPSNRHVFPFACVMRRLQGVPRFRAKGTPPRLILRWARPGRPRASLPMVYRAFPQFRLQ